MTSEEFYFLPVFFQQSFFQQSFFQQSFFQQSMEKALRDSESRLSKQEDRLRKV